MTYEEKQKEQNINNLSNLCLNVKSICVGSPKVFAWVKAPFEIKRVFNLRIKDASV